MRSRPHYHKTGTDDFPQRSHVNRRAEFEENSVRPFVVAIQFPAADDVRSESCTCSVVII